MPPVVQYKVKVPFASRGTGEPHAVGDVVSRDDLNADGLAWLLKSGAIVPHGPSHRGVTLLGDNPTPEQYQEEISRLQSVVETLEEENEQLRSDVGRLSAPRFESGGMVGSKGATPAPHAADNAGRKVKEAEARAEAMEAHNARLTAEFEEYKKKVAADLESRKAKSVQTPDGRTIPTGGSGTVPP